MLDAAEEFNALSVSEVSIDENSIGSRWEPVDTKQLAKLVAKIVMGQARFAANIINEIATTGGVISNEDLVNEATIKLSVQDTKERPRIGYPRHQRDGLIFEIISWIAARHTYPDTAYLKAPHISSTTQGLDGLMIELDNKKESIERTVIFEDKCTENPRGYFRDEVLPMFINRHNNNRSAELIDAASTLIALSGVEEGFIPSVVEDVLDTSKRSYRASFSLTKRSDTQPKRKKLFKGYDKLEDLTADQRVGACFIVEGAMRDWFEEPLRV